MQRRPFLRCVAAFAAASAFPSRAADAFPARAMTLLVAFAPGGVGDLVARSVSREASRLLGQPIVIDNRPVPTAAPATVAKSRPDGYTMMVTGNGTAITQVLFREPPFNLLRDFEHITTLAYFDLALVAGASSQFRSVADVVRYANANPGKLNIATVRIGSTQNLGAELLKSAAGIDAVIVPYRSTGDVMAALRTGDASVAVEIVAPVLKLLQSGTVRPLVVMSVNRFAGLPEVPTMIEAGFPGFEASSWNGISVPAATPQPVVYKLGNAFRAAVASAQVRNELQALGVVPRSSTPAEMTERLKIDIAKWETVIEKARIPRQ